MPNGGMIPAIMGAGTAIGGALGGLFGGGAKRYGSDVDRAMQQYRQYMQQAEQTLTGHEAAGRQDIQQALAAAQGYGAPYRGAGAAGLQAYLGSLGLPQQVTEATDMPYPDAGGMLPVSPPGTAATPESALDIARKMFESSPGYQFALKQGLQGVRRGMAAGGLRGSGAEERALQRYGTGLASQEYGAWQDRLKGLAGMGAETGERAAERAYGTGTALSGLGERYGGALAGLYGMLGQAGAESELAKAQMAAQERAERARGLGGLGLGGALLSAFL